MSHQPRSSHRISPSLLYYSQYLLITRITLTQCHQSRFLHPHMLSFVVGDSRRLRSSLIIPSSQTTDNPTSGPWYLYRISANLLFSPSAARFGHSIEYIIASKIQGAAAQTSSSQNHLTAVSFTTGHSITSPSSCSYLFSTSQQDSPITLGVTLPTSRSPPSQSTSVRPTHLARRHCWTGYGLVQRGL
jgi:hypothetical protein